MRPEAQVQSAIKILQQISETRKPADLQLRSWGQKNRFAGSKDRAAIGELVFAVLRQRSRYAAQMISEAPRALMIAHLHAMKSPADWQALFNGGPHAPGILSEEEMEMVHRQVEPLSLSTKYSIPEWALQDLSDTFGSDLEVEAKALLSRAPIDLRVNTLKSARKPARVHLQREGVNTEPGALSRKALRIETREGISPGKIIKTRTYMEGEVDVQDQGAIWILDQVTLRPGDTAIDLCAGGGGKTLGLATQMKNKGTLIATDVAQRRLSNVEPRLKRAGITCADLMHIVDWVPGKDKQDPNLEAYKEKADLVFLDVPCSGSGTWRRQPDAKWRTDPNLVHGYRIAQKNILERGARLVKAGGELVYVTCSLFYSENAAQIDRFLSDNPEFTPRELEPIEGLRKIGDGYQLSPHSTGTDGFFVAFLRKGK